MPELMVVGQQVWCPFCQLYAQMLKVQNAAKIVDVHTRTIYRYIEEGLVYSVKVAGKRYRVCSNCLLKQRANV
jgi:excisionase family DNA binding protein